MKKFIAAVLFSVLCFCVFYGVRYLENPVQTQTAISEVYESKTDTSGYIVRRERVLRKTASCQQYIPEMLRWKR